MKKVLKKAVFLIAIVLTLWSIFLKENAHIVFSINLLLLGIEMLLSSGKYNNPKNKTILIPSLMIALCGLGAFLLSFTGVTVKDDEKGILYICIILLIFAIFIAEKYIDKVLKE